MKAKRWILAGLAAAALAAWVGGASQPASQTAGRELRVVLLHVNDTHGHLLSSAPGGAGGYARLAAAVKEVRREPAERVFLVHCGDEFSRGDDLTTRTRGAANVTLMNALRFDLWTLGNGEFYDGLENLQARIRQARFPVLGANVRLKSGEPLAEPFVIEKAGPATIAFLGLCTVRMEPPIARELEAADPIATARELVARLRPQADVVVAVSHLGLPQDLKLAQQVGGIDVILGGHTHLKLPTGNRLQGPGGPVLICQAGEHLQYLGRVDLVLRPEGTRFRLAEAREKLIALDESVHPDEDVAALIARMSAAATQPAQPAAASRPAREPAAVVR